MADAKTPSGSEVAQTGVSGLGDFFSQLGGIALTGISRRVDMEFTDPVHTPDTATPAPKPEPPMRTGFVDAVTALTPLQVGGLVVAGALSWALVTGKFG